MNKYRIFIFLLLILGGIYYLYNKEESKDSVIDATVAVVDEGDEKKIEDGGVDSDVIKNDGDVMVEDEEDNDTIMQKDEEVKATEPNDKKDDDLIESDASAPMIIIENQSFTPYTNPATNYTIDRPDNWYWQHLYITELTKVFPKITDLFVANRLPLEEIESIYKSSIVIEVSTKDAAAVKEPVKNFDSKAVKIAEMDATRYEETRDDSEVIEYHLLLDNGKLVRFIYSATPVDNSEVAIFEHIVSSFTF